MSVIRHNGGHSVPVENEEVVTKIVDWMEWVLQGGKRSIHYFIITRFTCRVRRPIPQSEKSSQVPHLLRTKDQFLS